MSVRGAWILALALVVGGCAHREAERLAADGRAAYRAADWPRASQLLGAAVKEDGQNALLRTDLGWALMMQRECFPAREQFQRALDLEPGLAEAARGLEISSRCAAAASIR